ncbi:MAG: ATP synthase F1 subunit delta [Bacillota bacterium]|nr:ATP synthase F1 subunit delta [Bacillota bacterium]
MAELTSIIYAESLLDVSEEMGNTDEIKKELIDLRELFEKNADLYDFYVTPKINKENKKEVLKGIFADKLSPITLNLLCVLLDKRRAMEFSGVVRQYERLVSEKNNEVAGVVYLAKPCSDELLAKLEKRLSEVTGKNLKLKVSIDPSLVGGIKVKIGDNVVDATIASQLREMKGTIDNIIL